MLKHDLLSLLTVEQWAKFKRFVADRPTPVYKDTDGVGHPDFLTADVHEFLTAEQKYESSV